ncbi:hypothetical protein IAD21_03211 [Abditibacteriota bacterium]|nr:hypothetical protein IAD21_03211 [Abditibacteriota bacterium]
MPEDKTSYARLVKQREIHRGAVTQASQIAKSLSQFRTFVFLANDEEEEGHTFFLFSSKSKAF